MHELRALLHVYQGGQFLDADSNGEAGEGKAKGGNGGGGDSMVFETYARFFKRRIRLVWILHVLFAPVN